MSKLTLNEFREIKESMIKLLELSEQEYSSDNVVEEDFEEKILREYNTLQDRLLSSDLSDIPFEEWQGLYLFKDGELDLSNTHANIDFSLLSGIKYDSINLQGCNIKGIQALDYDENTFSAEYMKEHPEYFPDESIPAEIRQLFYEKKLQFSHLSQYPALRKCVNEHSFEREYNSPSGDLVETIGFENAVKLFDEYPEFITAITFEDENRSFYNRFYFGRDNFDSSKSYEEAKQFVYSKIIDEARKSYSQKLPALEVIPQEMIDSFPNVFIKQGELPEEIIQDYYKGDLSIAAIRHYSEVLKNKDLQFGTHSSSSIRAINKVFGDVWKFIEQVPKEYDHIVSNYLSKNAYDDEKIEQISQMEVQDIISDSIRGALNRDSWSRQYYGLDTLFDFSQYVPIEEIFEDPNLKSFVQKCGFENIVEFNRKNNMILERTGESYSSSTLLQEMAKYSSTIGEDVIVLDEQQLSDIFGQIIHQIRTSDDYSGKNILSSNKRELSTLYPSEFLDYNLLDTILKDMQPQDKEKVIERLERGFNGDTYLLEILNKNPFLLPALANKNLIISKNDWRLENFYQKVGSEKFLGLCSKYGGAVSQIINSFDFDNEKMEEFISQISGDNLEQQVNQYIYNLLGKNIRTFDLRILPQSFRSEHPELFIDENAPQELKDAFYGRNNWGNSYSLMDTQTIQEHPEWIPFLLKVDLSKCLESKNASVYDSQRKDSNGYSYAQLMNFYEALGIKFSQSEILDFVSKYGKCLRNANLGIDVSLDKAQLYDKLIENIYTLIIKRQIFNNEKSMPKEFREKYPDIFLSKDVPEELQNLFYQRKISPEIIQSHPEWKQLLQEKNIGAVCDMGVSAFVSHCNRLGFDNNKIFELFEKYGSCIAGCQIDISHINNINNIEALDSEIKKQMIEQITVQRTRYNEDAKSIIGNECPELFLDENAPQELKDAFYNYSTNNPLTFELLKQHKDWMPFLEGKNILLSLKKKNVGIRGLEQLFEKYGEQEALRIGMKNPESVMQMLSENKFDLLSEWYDKLHFIPHHVVMKEFPFEESDKFVASGKKWSQLMRIERHNINEDSKAALLKASMCFGVFDNDMDGFNKTMQLFSDIPKTIKSTDMQKMIDFVQKKISSLGDNPDPSLLEEYKQQLELINQCYGQNEENIYTLKINSQQNKNIVQTLRNIMEDSNVSTILTPDKAHKLFGGFEMKYEPDFRDFILKNMDEILTSDEYIAYISSMQKQWADIKAINSNRVLTLDLAMAFVKSNNYENVQVGNQKLAEVSSMAGYDQRSFDTLQQIYNYGKSRTFNSIPRVQTTNGEYTYEILRLDDPLAVAIGTLTDCCQELGNAAETSMEHSMVDKNGRVFVIKDEAGNIVAQSWVWRNQNVVCFDNIEIPAKAFTRAERGGSTREKFTDKVFELYKQAGEELIAKDEKEFKKLLDEGKITEEQYEALKLGKVTVGTGYNDIADSLRRNAQQDKSKVARPLKFVSPVTLNHGLYTSDSTTQYVIAGEQDVVTSSYETPTIYSDEFVIHDNSNTKQQDVLMLQKLELATKGDNYSGRTQSDETEKIVSDIAYNYGLNPETTKIIMNANFAIIYDTTNEEVVVGDILYNTVVGNQDQKIDISDKVAMQIRMAIEQIGVKGKKFNISHLSQEQLEMCNRAMNLDKEIDEERGLSHGSR